jgi:hypothetical protein
MRQLLNPRKTATLAAQTGLPIVKVMVRGNTHHRKDLCLEDGSIVCLWPDGSLTASGSRWSVKPEAVHA